MSRLRLRLARLWLSGLGRRVHGRGRLARLRLRVRRRRRLGRLLTKDLIVMLNRGQRLRRLLLESGLLLRVQMADDATGDGAGRRADQDARPGIPGGVPDHSPQDAAHRATSKRAGRRVAPGRQHHGHARQSHSNNSLYQFHVFSRFFGRYILDCQLPPLTGNVPAWWGEARTSRFNPTA